jgi:hypothetical protein
MLPKLIGNTPLKFYTTRVALATFSKAEQHNRLKGLPPVNCVKSMT